MHRRRRILSSLAHMEQLKCVSCIKFKMSFIELKDIFYNLEHQRNRQKNIRNKNAGNKKTSFCTHRCVSSLLPRYLRRENKPWRNLKRVRANPNLHGAAERGAEWRQWWRGRPWFRTHCHRPRSLTRQARGTDVCGLVSDLQPCHINIHNKVVKLYPLRATNEKITLKQTTFGILMHWAATLIGPEHMTKPVAPSRMWGLWPQC